MKNSITLLLFLGGVLMFNGCAASSNEDNKQSLYKSEAGRLASYSSYDTVMGLWDVEYSEEWVNSDFGATHIITCGPVDGKPLFLFPGLFADANMWYDNAGDLAQTYRVIAVDLPVFGGKSRPSERIIENTADYAEWFNSLLSHFNYSSAAIGGLSYGSWLSLALAREIPHQIEAVVMLDPSETFVKMRSIMAWKGFRYFVFFPNREKYRKFFDWMGGGFEDERSDIWLEHMLDVIEYGSVGMMDIPQHRVYTQDELTMVTMPLLILAAEKPIIYKDPQALISTAASVLPHAEVEIVEGTGHSLNVEKPEVVNGRILRFLGENYR